MIGDADGMPTTCPDCAGNMQVWLYPSGKLAFYSGGPFTGGKLSKADIERVLANPQKRKIIDVLKIAFEVIDAWVPFAHAEKILDEIDVLLKENEANDTINK